MNKITVYLAGPITVGNQFANVNEALKLTEELKQRDFVVFCPHWGMIQDIYKPWTYEEWMSYDEVWLSKCDCLLRMSGQSFGADREVVFAHKNNIPVFYSIAELEAWRESRNNVVQMGVEIDIVTYPPVNCVDGCLVCDAYWKNMGC